MDEHWTVGQIASISRVTVRTCRHRDRIWLPPARCDPAGRHRQGSDDLARVLVGGGWTGPRS